MVIEQLKPLKIYLDTTIISYLDQHDSPDKKADTHKFWDRIKAGQYNVYISRVTLDEINKCHEPKKTVLLNYLNEVEYQFVEITRDTEEVANKFIESHILTMKSIDDCRHIACSIVGGCDIIASWNFKHIVNYKTINGTKLVSLLTGYKEISIYTPTMLIAGEES